jgi:hypothetical protein
MQAEPGVTAAFEIGPSERRYLDLFCYAEPQALELCMTRLELSDAEWARVAHLFAETEIVRGRPRRDCRAILNAILWVKQTGAKWHRLPATYPPQQTCYAKYLIWRRTGLLQRVGELLAVEGLCRS